MSSDILTQLVYTQTHTQTHRCTCAHTHTVQRERERCVKYKASKENEETQATLLHCCEGWGVVVKKIFQGKDTHLSPSYVIPWFILSWPSQLPSQHHSFLIRKKWTNNSIICARFYSLSAPFPKLECEKSLFFVFFLHSFFNNSRSLMSTWSLAVVLFLILIYHDSPVCGFGVLLPYRVLWPN